MTITINTSGKTINIQGEIRLNELVSLANALDNYQEYEVILNTHKVTAYEVTYAFVHPTTQTIEVPPSWWKAGAGELR